MGCHHVGPAGGRKLCRAVGRDGGDEAVDEDGYAHDSPADIAADHACDVQASHLGDHIEDVVLVRLVDGDGLADHFDLMLQGLAGKAGSPSGHLGRVFGEQDGGDGGAGRRVADSHLPGDDHTVPLSAELLYHLDSGDNGAICLLSCHGRLLRDISGAVAHRAVPDPGMLSVGKHADIYRDDLESLHPGHDADGGDAISHVFQHLGGHLASGLADALGYHAVVRAHDDHHGV